MSSTYLALCQKFRRDVGIRGSGPTTVISQTGMFQNIVDWIADADEEIQSKYLDWGFLHTPFTEDTVVNIKDIMAPDNFAHWDVESFYLDYTETTWKQLIEMEYEDWRNSQRLGPQTSEEPDNFIIKPSKNIIIDPPPNGVYSLTADYWKIATRMTEDTSISLIPTRFDRLILAQAKLYYAEHEDAPEVFNSASAEYERRMNELESLYLPGQTSRTLADSGGLMTIVE